VRFTDLRFERFSSNRRAPTLSGYVVLDSKLKVVDMYVGGPRPPD